MSYLTFSLLPVTNLSEFAPTTKEASVLFTFITLLPFVSSIEGFVASDSTASLFEPSVISILVPTNSIFLVPSVKLNDLLELNEVTYLSYFASTPSELALNSCEFPLAYSICF